MDNQKITVRPATAADFDVIVAYNLAMAAETEEKTLDPATLTAGVRAALDDPTLCTYYVALIEDRIAGQTMVTVEWSDWRNAFFWWIQSVYVDAGFRRRGVYRSLYSYIRELAKSRGDVCGLRLYVYRANERAIKAYRDLGMSVSDYLLCEEDWSPSGVA